MWALLRASTPTFSSELDLNIFSRDPDSESKRLSDRADTFSRDYALYYAR